MKKKKIALIIAGAVSLGSYEAGVLTELLYALETLNRNANEDGHPLYELDVMTGGSAGGISSVIMARIMMYDLQGRRQHLHSVWVNDVDIRGFMKDIPANALFSKDLIDQLAQKYVVSGSGHPPSNVASFAPDELRLSLSLSNMNGVDYEVPYITSKEGGFDSTFYSEEASFSIKKGALPNEEAWKTMADTAIACGNFPIAFQPQLLFRKAEDYPGSIQALKDEYFPTEMAFVDGGMFDNEPLREAIHLAAEADGGVIDPDRLFIVIDPNINRSGHQPEIEADIFLPNYVGRLITMIKSESMANDWMRANRRNVELEWRDAFVNDLIEIVRCIPDEQLATLRAQIKSTANEIVEKKREMLGSDRYPEGYLKDALALVQERQIDHVKTLDLEEKREIFTTLVFLVNNVAGLQHKSPLNLALIGSDPDKTAGDKLFAFGGFFDEMWREHDYRLGRIEANKNLPSLLGADYPKEMDQQGLPVRDYIIPLEWEGFAGVGIGDIDPELRQQLRDIVVKKVTDTLEFLKANWFYTWIAKIIVKRLLNKQLLLKQGIFK